MGLNSRELCILPFPPQKEQSRPRSTTKSDLFGTDRIRLSCLQSPAETETLAGGKGSRAPLNLPWLQRPGMSPGGPTSDFNGWFCNNSGCYAPLGGLRPMRKKRFPQSFSCPPEGWVERMKRWAQPVHGHSLRGTGPESEARGREPTDQLLCPPHRCPPATSL